MLNLTPTGLRLSNSATLEQCTALYQQARTLWSQLPSTGPIEIEFDSLSRIDSSLVALLLEWQEEAQTQSRYLSLKNVPANLKHLAKLYGIDNWIEGLASP